jgi:hypothetical protein
MRTTTVARATATATSSAPAIVAALALVGVATLAGCGSATPPATSQQRAFAWLRPSPAPPTWQVSRLPGGGSRLAYPRGWLPIKTDPGTASAAVRSRSGGIQGYLNATPQQGPETLSNWRSFRPDHNRQEGDLNVVPVASATNVPFRGGRGSCVIDSYTSSTGRQYREIACIVAGRTATTVVVGAAPPSHWQQEAPVLERSISAFTA